MLLAINAQGHIPPPPPRLPEPEAELAEIIPRNHQIIHQRAAVVFKLLALVTAVTMTEFLWKAWYDDSDTFDHDTPTQKKVWMCLAIIAVEQIFLCVREIRA